MKKIILFVVVLVSFWVAVPWSIIGFPALDSKVGDYKLGLDLHGGISIDYLVDFPEDMTPENRLRAVETLKTKLDGRVRQIGTTEPILKTASYGEETHIVIEIPTPNEFDQLSEVDRNEKNEQYIKEAKETIGQVIKIQFKEPRNPEEFATLLSKRPALISSIEKEFENNKTPFGSFAHRISNNNENIFYLRNNDIKNILNVDSVSFESLKKIFPSLPEKLPNNNYSTIYKNTTFTIPENISGFPPQSGRKGDVIINITSIGGLTEAQVLFIDSEPLGFKPAKGKNDEILDERYLISATPAQNQTGISFDVKLDFSEEGNKMFGDITERNIGSSIAIFLSNKLLTNANVRARIDGGGVIQGGGGDTKTWATDLSKSINEGIVPVGIYEHSEQIIGPNLGKASLMELIISGVIGLIVMYGFLLWRYGLSGIVAGISLIIYVFVLLALVRLMGITLTLSGVAGIVLSLGLAIDSNVLLLERVRDFLDTGKDMKTSLKLGFREAWSAVWDSHITGLLVGLVLWWMGVSLVKGFGQMTVLGIIVSLIVVRYICNPLTIWLRNKMS